MSLYKLLQEKYKDIKINMDSDEPLKVKQEVLVVYNKKTNNGNEDLTFREEDLNFDYSRIAKALITYGNRNDENNRIKVEQCYNENERQLNKVKSLEELKEYSEKAYCKFIDDEYILKSMSRFVQTLTGLNYKKFNVPLEGFSVKDVYVMSEDDVTFLDNIIKYFFAQRVKSIRNSKYSKNHIKCREFTEYSKKEAQLLADYILKILGGE